MECLVYNCPDQLFNVDSYFESFLAVLLYLEKILDDAERASKMVEVNELKELFSPGQAWKREQGQALVSAALGTIRQMRKL